MNKSNETEKTKKSKMIGISVIGVILVAIIAVGIFAGVDQYGDEKEKMKAFDTSSYAKKAAEENAFQFSDTVVEVDSKIFAVDSSKITVRNSGSNREKTLVEGNIDAGIVTDSKTVYYYDLDTNKIMSIDVKSKKKKEIINVPENVKPDEKSQINRFFILIKRYFHW